VNAWLLCLQAWKPHNVFVTSTVQTLKIYSIDLKVSFISIICYESQNHVNLVDKVYFTTIYQYNVCYYSLYSVLVFWLAKSLQITIDDICRCPCYFLAKTVICKGDWMWAAWNIPVVFHKKIQIYKQQIGCVLMVVLLQIMKRWYIIKQLLNLACTHVINNYSHQICDRYMSQFCKISAKYMYESICHISATYRNLAP
jgi:hypothetical protein